MVRKKVGRPRPRRTPKEWSALFRCWRRTGQDLETFCKNANIRVKTFKWWIWRLSLESPKRNKNKRISAKKRGRPPKKVGLVRVELERSGRDQPSADGSRESVGAWTLTTSNGLVLEVRGMVDESGLQTVLKALSKEGGLK